MLSSEAETVSFCGAAGVMVRSCVPLASSWISSESDPPPVPSSD